MSDEMRPRLDELLEPRRLVLEVDPLDLRARREAAPVRHDELEALPEGPLGRPRDLAVDDAAVDEEDPRTGDPAILGTGTK
jgi:hypothetical protein